MALNNTDAPDNMFVGDLRIEGTLLAEKDNATSFRLRGPDINGDVRQSYGGMFYNAGYDVLGVKETRASFGANLEMDLALQSPHGLLLLAVDNTQADGKLIFATRTDAHIHARADAETPSPKRVVLDRETTGTTGAANTSNATVETNSGDLVIWPGRQGSETEAKTTLKHFMSLEVLGGDPSSPVDGDVWRTAAGLRGKIGGNVGTFDFTPD